jgi:hypothetical protein
MKNKSCNQIKKWSSSSQCNLPVWFYKIIIYFIINTTTTELHQIENQLVSNIALIAKKEKSPDTALKQNNTSFYPKIAALYY